MRMLVAGMLAIVTLIVPRAVAQQADKDVTELLDQYQAAWNKGDAKGLAALYTENAIRIGADATPVAGRAAIEQSFVKNFDGPWKGTRLITKTNRTQSVNADVQIVEGTYELSGGSSGPQRGRFLNTVVREGSRWRLAGLAAIPQASAPR